MKELDLILKGWLERRYELATAEERMQFARFLELPDPEIARYLLGQSPPRDPSTAALMSSVRDSIPSASMTSCA